MKLIKQIFRFGKHSPLENYKLPPNKKEFKTSKEAFEFVRNGKNDVVLLGKDKTIVYYE